MGEKDPETFDRNIPEVSKPVFYPVTPLEDKHNFKRFLRVEPDGSVTERVFLDVSDMRDREHLICLHYLRFYTKFVLRADTGINFIARDKPWDFSIALSSGEAFNLEVVSIAENPLLFEINKREERFNAIRQDRAITIRELSKLLMFFPDDALSNNVRAARDAGISKDALIDNPFYGESGVVFVSALPDSAEPLDQLIRSAIVGKSNKPHKDKSSTVLIVDNRTSTYDTPDVQSACAQLELFFADAPFPEIWFYTGYCSDDDGNRAEFTFFPLKVPGRWADVFSGLAMSNHLDEYNRFVY